MCINDSYGGAPGTDNVFAGNDCYRDPGGIARVSAIKMYGNTTTNPRFVNAARHNYALLPTSSLLGRGSKMNATLLPTSTPVPGRSTPGATGEPIATGGILPIGPGAASGPPPLPTSDSGTGTAP
jgi:hypothetical protein